eukprot:Pgem_evm1s13066
MKFVKETVTDYHKMNSVKPIWSRSKDEVEEEEYKEFFKTVFKEPEDPTSHIHFNAEGEISFKSLLYIPKAPPQDMMNNY